MDLGPTEILRTPLFYLLWTMYAFAAGAGLMIIGNITTIAKLGKIEAGFILVALLAVGNAAGRIIAGMLSDRIGRLWTMCINFLFQAGLMMVLRTGLADMTAFVIVSMLLGFNYGACLSVFPSAVKDNFGLKNFGINYGLVFTAWGVGGFVFPILAGMEGTSSLYVGFGLKRGGAAEPERREAATTAALRRAGSLDGEERVVARDFVRIDPGYVIFDRARRRVMARVIPDLESRGVLPIGRYGAWTYSYMERAMLDGLEAAERLRRGA